MEISPANPLFYFKRETFRVKAFVKPLNCCGVVTLALKASDGGTDSALLMETGAENADLCVAQDLKTFYVQLGDMNHFFKVYEAVVPRIKRPQAICEITGIT